jgi:hypothetical protein
MGNAGVRGIAGDRVYDRVARPNTKRPYVVFQRIAVAEEYTFGGLTRLVVPTFQVECWGNDADDVENLAEAVKSALAGDGFHLSEMDDYEPGPEGGDRHDYVTRLDFELLHEANT